MATLNSGIHISGGKVYRAGDDVPVKSDRLGDRIKTEEVKVVEPPKASTSSNLSDTLLLPKAKLIAALDAASETDLATLYELEMKGKNRPEIMEEMQKRFRK
jgi:hypothetical protein